MTEDDIDFDRIAEELTSIGTLTSPAEFHGMICGRLSGGLRCSDEMWMQSMTEFLDPVTNIDEKYRGSLLNYYRQTLVGLQDQHLRFAPVLPADDVELSLRIEALCQWCHGFLSGFGSSGISKDTELTAETAEILRDLAAFVQLDKDCVEDEEGERDFAEVVEYVRIATLSVFMEMGVNPSGESNVTSTSKKQEPTLH